MALTRKKFDLEVGGKQLTIEVSQLADQANASVIAKYGETVVLATVVMSKDDKNLDYLPLKVDYEERFYAAGKIIGSRFIRREGRASEEAILAGRLVDRTIRPLFDDKMRRDIQVVVTVIQIDEENDPDFVGLIGASVALAASDVPWGGPVAGIRIAQYGSTFKINPTASELKAEKPVFEAFVAGTEGKINMIELGGYEAKEKDIVKGFEAAQKEIDRIIAFENKIVKEIGKQKTEVKLVAIDPDLKAAVHGFIDGKLEHAIYQKTKAEHYAKLGELKHNLFEHLKEKYTAEEKEVDWKAADFLFEDAINDIVHKNILESGKRPDGRKLDEVRELNGEVGLLSRNHGSAVFIRGNTQALAVTTLAAPGAEQIIETMETDEKRRFMLHYNFPPYSVGEIGNFRGPGRREIGHGNLARKAVEPLLPAKDQFPYIIRVVSEILGSNGSSSMATVCASVLSLMDAGVPIKKPAAGIAMGLMMKDEKNFKVLTDIQGPEDHHGDMDFKVAGTDEGVNAMQMDVKVDGVTIEILEKGLAQARDARLHILKFMNTVLDAPRPKLSPHVPIIKFFSINPEKIGTLIGPGGKMINGLIERYELSGINVEDDGSVAVSGKNEANVLAAVKEIESLVKEYKVGDVVEGNIIKILEFGAIVDLGGGNDGMIHVSELKQGFVKKVEDVVKLGDFVRAKVIRVEDGRIGLSIKQLQ